MTSAALQKVQPLEQRLVLIAIFADFLGLYRRVRSRSGLAVSGIANRLLRVQRTGPVARRLKLDGWIGR